MNDLFGKGYFIFRGFGEQINLGHFGDFIQVKLSYTKQEYNFYVNMDNLEKLKNKLEENSGYSLSLRVFMHYFDKNNRIFIEVVDIVDNFEKSEKGFGKITFENILVRYLSENYISITDEFVSSADEDFNKKRIGVNINSKWNKAFLENIQKSKIYSTEKKLLDAVDSEKEELERERENNLFSKLEVALTNNPDFNHVLLFNSVKK